MAFPSLDPSQIFRDFTTNGIPASGKWDPRKAEIRRFLNEIVQAIIALIGGEGGDIELARGVISFSVTGGTANDIIAEPDSDLPETPGSAVYIIGGIAQESTGPVTINGKPLLTNSGNEIVAGGLVTGGIYLFLDDGTNFRLVSDQASAAIVAAAEVAVNHAEEWAQSNNPIGADAGGDGINDRSAKWWADLTSNLASAFIIAENTFATKATAEAWHPVAAPDYIRLAGLNAPGDGGGFLAKKVSSEPSHAGKFSITLDDGVTVVWYENVDIRVNPMQFGATRSSGSDALSAITAQQTILKSFSSMASGGVSTGDRETLYLPHGIYQISDTIVSTNVYSKIVGDKAKIVPAPGFDQSKWAMDLTLWHGRVEGLIFDGFEKSLYIHNPNTDRGNIKVIDCEFNGELVAAAIDAQSTKVVFRDCQWNRCVRALDQINCDFVEIDGGWIKQGNLTEDYSATIESTGILHIHDVLGVPNPATGAKTAWINNNSGAVKASHMRFGGESGAKTIVNNFAQADTVYPIVPTGVLLEGCEIYTTSQPAVRCFRFPNYIVGRDNGGYADLSAFVAFDGRDATVDDEIARVRNFFEIKWQDNRPITNRVIDQASMLNASVYVTSGDKISYPLSVSLNTPRELLFRGNNTREQNVDFKRYNAFRVTLFSNNVPTNDNVSEYILQAGFNNADAYQLTAVREGAGNSAPRLYKDADDGNKLKVRLNVTVGGTRVWCVVEQLRINGFAYDQS